MGLNFGASNKNALLIALRQLLKAATLTTQEEIKIALRTQGLEINQAQISRLLHQLRAVKVLENNQLVYRLPTEATSPASTEAHLANLILEIEHNQSLIVIHTTPGSAQLIGRFLDQKKYSTILGTLAGDDTVFVAPRSIATIEKLMQDIMTWVHES